MHLAAEYDYDEIASFICESHPEMLILRERIEGNTPLHVACIHNSLSTLKVFCEVIEIEAQGQGVESGDQSTYIEEEEDDGDDLDARMKRLDSDRSAKERKRMEKELDIRIVDKIAKKKTALTMENKEKLTPLEEANMNDSIDCYNFLNQRYKRSRCSYCAIF